MTFNYQETLVTGTVARISGGGQLEALFQGIESAFGFFASESGVANAYVLTMSQPVSSLSNGQVVVWQPGNTNTSRTCTANVDGTGAVPITLQDGTLPYIGDIRAGYFTVMRYNSTNTAWEIISITYSIISAISAVESLSAAGGALASVTDTVVGPLWSKLVPANQSNISAKTSDDTLVANDLIGVVRTLNDGGGNESISFGYSTPTITNTGASSTVSITMPAATAGLECLFFVAEAQELRSVPNGTDVFTYGGTDTAATDYLYSSSVGTWWHIKCVVAGKWEIINLRGVVNYT